MGKWIAGVAATVVSGVLVFWLTQGLRQEKTPDRPVMSQSVASAASTKIPTLHDLRGRYMLVMIEPVEDSYGLPPDLGITIEPRTATEGFARYRLPMKMDGQGVPGFGDHAEGYEYVALVGSRLRIVLGRTTSGEVMSMWRDVYYTDPYLVLSWQARDKKRTWTFRKM